MIKIIILFCAVIQVLRANPISPGLQYASQFESPWLALITIDNQRCGGSLVHNKFIITAAHCFDDINIKSPVDVKKIKVKLGEWKTETNPDCNENVSGESCDHVAEIPVKEVKIHKDYEVTQTKNKYKNDIAVLKLAWKPRKSDLIESIKLPKSKRCDMNFANEKWSFTGFGKIPGGKFTTIKKKMNLDIISNDGCKQEMQESEKIFLKDTHVCGKNSATQTCKGDSGSGVTRKVNGTTYLEGIVSFGAENCEVGSLFPTGLLKVSCFKSWIKNQINDLDSDSDADESLSSESDEEKSNTVTDDALRQNNEDDDENQENTTIGMFIEESDNDNDVF